MEDQDFEGVEDTRQIETDFDEVIESGPLYWDGEWDRSSLV